MATSPTAIVVPVCISMTFTATFTDSPCPVVVLAKTVSAPVYKANCFATSGLTRSRDFTGIEFLVAHRASNAHGERSLINFSTIQSRCVVQELSSPPQIEERRQLQSAEWGSKEPWLPQS